MEPTPGSDPQRNGPAHDGARWSAPVFANSDSEVRLRSLIEDRGAGIRVRVDGPSDLDVVGHALGGAGELTLTILDGEDDTEGHAISLHFPSLEEAKRFQNRMLATGAIVGTLVIAGTGLALTQALPDAGTAGGVQSAQVQSAVPGFASVDNMGGTQVQSAVPGFASVDNMGGTQSAVEGATAGSQAWADQGFGADLSNAVADPTTGGQAAADAGYGAQPATAGSQAWADEGFGADLSNAVADPTIGGQAASDPSYGGTTSDTDDSGSGGKQVGPQPR